MLVGIDSQLSLILAFWTDLKRTWNPHSFSRNKTLQLVVQAAEFKFESKIKPLPVIWQSLLDCHFQKTIQDFNSWFNGRALLVTLMQGFGWSHLQAQTQGVSKQVAVLLAATGSLEETLLPAYHSFDTDSVLESKRFQCFVNFGWWLQIFFLIWNEIMVELARSCYWPKSCASGSAGYWPKLCSSLSQEPRRWKLKIITTVPWKLEITCNKIRCQIVQTIASRKLCLL